MIFLDPLVVYNCCQTITKQMLFSYLALIKLNDLPLSHSLFVLIQLWILPNEHEKLDIWNYFGTKSKARNLKYRIQIFWLTLYYVMRCAIFRKVNCLNKQFKCWIRIKEHYAFHKITQNFRFSFGYKWSVLIDVMSIKSIY